MNGHDFTLEQNMEARIRLATARREWAGWCVASGIFVLLLMALVSGMDFGLGKLTLWVFG